MTERSEQGPILAPDNESVVKHVEMYQGIITRMAGNIAACKMWGIPLVAAILSARLFRIICTSALWVLRGGILINAFLSYRNKNSHALIAVSFMQ